MPAIDFHRLKQIIPLGEVMRLLNIPWTRFSAVTVRGRCPLHCCEDQRACNYNGIGQLWYCHHCKQGGSALDLWCKVKHVTIFAAAVQLCELLQRELPLLSVARAGKDRAWKDSDPPLDTGA